jgi:hypothetical protein
MSLDRDDDPARSRAGAAPVAREAAPFTVTRRVARAAGLVFVCAGVLTLIWAFVVWQWQDPFTALYTTWQQHRLESELNQEFQVFARPPAHTRVLRNPTAEARALERDATRLRRTAGVGQAIGRIVIPRLGLNMIVVNGTDEGSLTRGPGRDLRTYMSGRSDHAQDAVRDVSLSSAPPSHSPSLRHGGPAIASARATRPSGMPPPFLRNPSLHRLRASGVGANARRFFALRADSGGRPWLERAKGGTVAVPPSVSASAPGPGQALFF